MLLEAKPVRTVIVLGVCAYMGSPTADVCDTASKPGDLDKFEGETITIARFMEGFIALSDQMVTPPPRCIGVESGNATDSMECIKRRTTSTENDDQWVPNALAT